MSIEIKCDICKKKIEGSMFVTVKTTGINLDQGYHDTTEHRCNKCEKLVESFVQSITKE
jgi:hypothetical protein